MKYSINHNLSEKLWIVGRHSRKTAHLSEQGSIFVRVVLLLCGVVCALAALMFLFFWGISERRTSTEDKVSAIFFVALLSFASVLSLVAAIRKK